MFRIIRDMFLIGLTAPRRDTPVAPLGLWGVGILFSIHLPPLWGFVGSLVHRFIGLSDSTEAMGYRSYGTRSQIPNLLN